MPVDRHTILRNAGKLLLQSKVALAIDEYLRVLADQPGDWSTASLLGDLYVRTGQPGQALEQYLRAAQGLAADGFLTRAAPLYGKVLRLHPDHLDARAQGAYAGLTLRGPDAVDEAVRTARALGDAGRVDAARALCEAAMAADATGRTARLLRAEIELLDGNRDAARQAVDEMLVLGAVDAAGLLDHALALAPWRAGDAYVFVDAAVAAAVRGRDWHEAAALLHAFVAHAPGHAPALERLVDVVVDGALGDEALYEARARLADAYLTTGLAAEARCIAEDLFVARPSDAVNVERCRRALRALGEHDPDAVMAGWLRSRDEHDAAAGSARAATAAPPPGAERVEPMEVDLSGALAGLGGPPSARVQDHPGREEPGKSSEESVPDLDEVFAELRAGVLREAAGGTAEAELARGVALHAAGDLDGCIPSLRTAARAPHLRFRAASRLARIFRDRGQILEAVDWFERAADAPAPASDEAYLLLYDLAETLEDVGETARALAIYLELQAAAGDYRDVAARVGRLADAQAEG